MNATQSPQYPFARAREGASDLRPYRAMQRAARLVVSLAAALSLSLVGACATESSEPRDDPESADAVTVVDEEVRIGVDTAITLAGNFTRPLGAIGPVGAVLLLGGSGPQDRDGARPELPGYAPWRDLAQSLGRAGFAVLRLDDRGTGASTGQFAGSTTEDFARDARAAIAWIRQQSAVRADRVAIVGHSEGAVVALLVARDDAAVGALVLLGAPSRSGREIARWQREALVTSDMARWPPAERASVLAAAERHADSLAQHDPWLHTWFALDPREIARGVRVPVLLLHGDTDRQVPPAHADELAAVLRRAGATPVDVQHISDTDHLLLADADGDPEGYVRLAERRLRPSVLRETTHFLSIHMRPRGR